MGEENLEGRTERERKIGRGMEGRSRPRGREGGRERGREGAYATFDNPNPAKQKQT